MTRERNYGIDMLRLILMFMVCVLHTLGKGGVLNACISGSMNYNVFWILEILSYCAVDSFAIISGYMAKDKPQKYEKIVNMWFEAFFYSFILTVVLMVAKVGKGIGKFALIKLAFPITFSSFWYFTAYFILFLAMPILNKFLFSIDEVAAKKVFVFLVFIFTIVNFFANPFGLNYGYSAMWIIVLYCIGVLARRIKLFEKRSSVVLVVLYILPCILTFILFLLTAKQKFVLYTSPLVFLSALALVVLFSRIKLKGKIISKLSPLAFGIYLFQQNPIIWNNIIKDRFTFVINKPIVIGVLYVLLLALAIFVSGLIIEFIRNKIVNLIRIPILSQKIVRLSDKATTKLSVFLK